LLQQEISLSGVPVHVTDTAGLRDSSDVVEQEGVRRARKALGSADQILLVIDSSEFDQAAVASGDIDLAELLAPLNLAGLEVADQQALLRRTTLILNKIDLAFSSSASPSTGQQDAPEPHIKSTSYQGNSLTLIGLSAKEKLGISLLTNHLLDIVGFRAGGDGVFVARERHLRALRAAGNCLDKAVLGVSEHSQLELVAEDLRLAQRYLGEITGEVSSDDLLGKIFSSFCVGK
jgi:tRNA modification GTPase